jgi:tripartite ATP-independent transporter DctM subunit
LGFIIPPSLVFIVYGILSNQSIGVLFMSGIMPGLLLAVLFIITIYIVCRVNPKMGPSGPKASWMERAKATPRLIPVLVIIVLVLGGIYTGVFTPTEAAGIGVFVLLILTMATRQIKWRDFVLAIEDAAMLTAMVFILIIGAIIFSRFLIISEVPMGLAHFITGLTMPPIYILIFVLIAYLIIGCIMDILAVLIVLIPILHPLLVGLGFDPVWLAVLTCITVLVGGLTPPVGVVVFALSGMFKDVPMYKIFRGTYPFIGAMFICLIILVAFPEISLWLPGRMSPG